MLDCLFGLGEWSWFGCVVVFSLVVNVVVIVWFVGMCYG